MSLRSAGIKCGSGNPISSVVALGWRATKLEIPDEDVHLIVRALEHYYAYTVARKSEDARFKDLAQKLKRKPAEQAPTSPPKQSKRRA